MEFCGVHLRPILQEVLKISIYKIGLKIYLLIYFHISQMPMTSNDMDSNDNKH